jgi:HK97 gp10 family phage protein
MADGFDTRELEQLTKDLLALANDVSEKESKKFLMNEGSKLRKVTLKDAKSKIKKKTGNLFNSIKRGKVYRFNGALSIRVYGKGHHSHLLNYGHRIIGKDGTEHGFAKGYHFFEDAQKQFQNEYVQDCENFVQDLIDSNNL